MSRPSNPPPAENACCGGRPHPDEVLEAGVESFPASDPPAWTAGREEEPETPKVSGRCCCAARRDGR